MNISHNQKILKSLDDKLESENLKKIRNCIDSEENINWRFVKICLDYHSKKNSKKNSTINKIRTEISRRDNTISNNNIIIHKLNDTLTNTKTKLKNCQVELIRISNLYTLDTFNYDEALKNKDKIINEDKQQIYSLKKKLLYITKSAGKKDMTLEKYNNEIYFIYKYSMYILLFNTFVSYLDISNYFIQFCSAFMSSAIVFIKYRIYN